MTDFQKDVLDRSQERPVIVDFGAAWCTPCRMIKPVLKEAIKGKDIILKFIDVDNEPDIAQKFNIRSVPHIIAFRKGEFFSKWDRTQPVSVWINSVLNP